ncbi:DUF6290 family protein [Mycoplasma sp. Ms02]|uniref:DUF6290 family protein n=1 Tax=Mycoplasma sp. Ms02 TaxID=353851 RepID=UPI001C88F0C7|nr:DUF6290 family protein [Mycoplasma sp. Ms02]QZE12360.1 ribbon-helix-helix protein, CopG family [Mycoplasma sp. Ms02]
MKLISVKVSDADKKVLEDYAKSQGKTISQVVREAIFLKIKEFGEPNELSEFSDNLD